ncbi:MAG: hypothetical protein GW925_00925 [Candidatus Pacebacteria bacterium]|nr:hypothetical protein [Candidatus Paceibacterota bacterium]
MRKNSFIDQLKSLRHGQQLLAIIILLLIVSIGWIFLGIFAGQQTSKISPELTKAASPLTPQLDDTILEEIENKHEYTKEELENFPIYKVISINRGKEQTIVPISYDESEQEEKSKPTVTLDKIAAPSPDPQTSSDTQTPDAETTTETTPTPQPTSSPDTTNEPAL